MRPRVLRRTSILLLLIVGVNAIIGGHLLMVDPTGSGIQLSQDFINATPFHDYFFPGLILFASVGILSLAASLAALLKWNNYSRLILLQGIIITGWIMVQITIIRHIFWLQFVVGGIGILLVLLGLKLLKFRNEPM